MRLTAIVCACVILGACALPQSDRFVVRAVGDTFAVYPPGPLPEGQADILIPGVVNPEGEAECFDIPIVPGETVIGARMHPPYKAITDQELVITVDASIRTDRAKVADAITTFIAAQTGDSVDSQLDCLVSGAGPLITATVIDSVPVAYDDMLALAFDVDVESRSVELRPGQSFCVEYAAGRFRNNSVTTEEHLKFFSGGADQCYRLDRIPGGHSGTDALTFSPFLRRIGGINVADVNSTGPNHMGPRDAISRRVAGTVDLGDRNSTFDIKRYRLFYNDTIAAYSDIKPPFENWTETPVLIGSHCPGGMEMFKRLKTNERAKVCTDPRAFDWKTNIRMAFSSLANDDPTLAALFSSCAGPDFDNWRPVCHIFNERGVPFPQVDVVIDGKPETVEMNRTVWQVLEQGGIHRYANLRRDGTPETLVSQTMARELASLRVHRRFQGRRYPVHFETISMEALMLPLLPGDEVAR